MSEVTFEPFQKVLVRNDDIAYWGIDFFEEYAETFEYPYVCLTNSYKQCLPYNDETKHLLGTTDSPTPPEPEFRWGDHVEVRDEIDDKWRKAVYIKAAESDNFPYVVIVLDNSTDITLHYKYRFCRHADW